MKYSKLPTTDLEVSKICLGTMTYGEQNTEAEGHEQMDYALTQGVNFFDTAEMYSVPSREETYGSTEKIIGTWFTKTGNRDKVVLASKIAGPGYFDYIRSTGFAKDAIKEAIHGSLTRLQTDYIDLYQLHWPERPINCFGTRDYPYYVESEWQDNFEAVLTSLQELVKEGKIRHIGLSNESPWGVMKYLELSRTKQLPRPVTIQNAYSLLHRSFEIGLSEVSLREQVGLLAYSPLAFGVLSGKYLIDNPADGRVSLYPAYNRYSSEQSAKAVKLYQAIAKKHNLSITQMALAFVNQLPFVTSNIIGATKMSQLKENIDSINVVLNKKVIEEINAVHGIFPSPAA